MLLERFDLFGILPAFIVGLIAPGIVQGRAGLIQNAGLVGIRKHIIAGGFVVVHAVSETGIDQAVWLVLFDQRLQFLAAFHRNDKRCIEPDKSQITIPRHQNKWG